ncbi:MAG TPA: T9SS type A sorting domain-containing protein [Parafilimonas sp.]|nr:T9SS type A sorting domain-containing protein [Parafilimonas sp.]
MKNLLTILLLFAVHFAQGQYFQQRFNLDYSTPRYRNERCNSGIITRVNLAGGSPAGYYFAGIGTSYKNDSLKSPDNLADRMRFQQLNNVGTAVISNLGYHFSDAAGGPVLHSYGNSIAEVKNAKYNGGYVAVGEVKKNSKTGATVPGGSDALFVRLNSAGGVVGAVRYDVNKGSDRAWCIRRSAVTVNGNPTWIICGESKQTSTNTVCFVARILASGAIVWFNAYSFDPSGGTFSSSINIAKQLCEDAAGYIYVVGTLQDVPAGATGIDALAFKLTPAGAVVWANNYHLFTDDEYQAVRFTADGNIITGGFTNFGAAAPVTHHMLIAKLASANGAVIFDNVLVARNGNTTYTSKAYDIIETAGPQYFLAGPAIRNNNIYEMMYKVNAGGFPINWYRYNRMNYNVGFGLDNTYELYPGIGYFSSLRNPDTTRISDSHIMKTNYNGQTCKFCDAYPPYYIQVNLQLYQRAHVYKSGAKVKKLVPQIFKYDNKLICNDQEIHCNNIALNGGGEVAETMLQQIQTSPNPVNSVLNLQFKNIKPGNYSIMVADRQGNIVLQKAKVYCDDRSIVKLNVSGLRAGFYLVRISDGINTLEQKVLKE